jgi:hypothetical protein
MITVPIWSRHSKPARLTRIPYNESKSMYLYNNLCTRISQQYTDTSGAALRNHLLLRKPHASARKKSADSLLRKTQTNR